MTLSICLDTDENQCFVFHFFFFLRRATSGIMHCSVGPMHWSVSPVHCLRNPQISFFIKTFIKNGSHCTIHTFKNYFTTVFLVFSKISCIQTDPNSQIIYQGNASPALAVCDKPNILVMIL